MPDRVLVTGASGFIGSAVMRALQREGAAYVAAVDLREPDTGDARIAADLTRAAIFEELLAAHRPDIVVHLAGPSPDSPEAVLSALGSGMTGALLEAVQLHAPETVVVVPGSAAEYGPVPEAAQPIAETTVPSPVTPYGTEKLRQTRLVADYAARGVRAVSARVFNPVGAGAPEFTLLGSLVSKMALAEPGAPVLVGDLSAVRDFVHVDDVAEALLVLARRARPGSVHNVCTGVGTRARDLAAAIASELGAGEVVETGAGSAASGSVSVAVGSPELTARDTGWRASRSWRQAVRDAAQEAKA